MYSAEQNEDRVEGHAEERPPNEPYTPPTILWEQKFVALATCSFNPCACVPPPPQCGGG